MNQGYTSDSYIFDPRPSYNLLTTVKRFWKPNSAQSKDPAALTLIFTHGTSFHKEQWEPAIDDLLETIAKGGHKVKIREIWTIDCPNHGEAAAVNEHTLFNGYRNKDSFAWEEYGRSIHLFLAGLGTGVKVDFTGHRLVGIAHSMGAVSMSLSLGYYPKIRFTSFIFAEIMTMSEDIISKATEMLVSGAEKRRDIWPTKEDAYKVLKSRGTWKSWDDRVLKHYVDSGLRPLPTAEYPDKTEGVTLKCTRSQEAACYRDNIGARRVWYNFEDVVKRVPTHIIYGGVNDYIPGHVKDQLINEQSGGLSNLASVSRVPGSGHLVSSL
ncbi:hypothetical protein CPC08DRAFT_637383 [Agrocybe pediades]|nr:hypothetical protein CPC08DRAFT_637383 [Agrocybe pediades]